MARKAPQRQSRATLPLDDPRWIPLADAQRRVRRRTGSDEFADHDLTEALASGKVRSMHRSPERKPVPRSRWRTDYELCTFEDGVVSVFTRKIQTNRSVPGMFYVWAPDIEAVFPSAPAADAEPDEHPVSAHPRGPAPKRDWKKHVGRELARRAFADPLWV